MRERLKAARHAAGGARLRTLFTSAVALVVLFVVAIPAMATHPEASLPGSNFEIDTDANLKVDDPSPSIDWASVIDVRRADAPTGQNDDSYQGGTKEDTSCPGEVTGSIPNNKSDLLTFGAYVEPEVDGPGFLNLFWSRVADPSGTTLMDFELNQSDTNCPGGPNKVRTAGDLLIEYSIDQGGAQANITIREWSGSAWGAPVPTVGNAVGTINSSPIPAAESDGLGARQARTFGEAQIDLDFIFDEGKCESFGSAMLKSRSSDAFTSQLKDFIRPIPIDLTNCGTVIIRKQTNPDEDPNTTEFGYTKEFGTDPASDDAFTLMDDGVKTFNNVLFGSGYTVTEDVIGDGYDFEGLDCSASSAGVTYEVDGATVTFDIDNAADVLDCTYTNRARATIIVEKITTDGQGAFDFTSGTLTPSPFTLTTTGTGTAGMDSKTFDNLSPGTYDVAEIEPLGWNLASATCDDGSDPAAISLSAGETVTCTFTNELERGAIEITKTRKHAAAEGGTDVHAGVTFTITGGELPVAGVDVVTDANGVVCLGELLYGDYTVTETVPSGYVSDDAEKAVSVSVESTCGDGNEATVSFVNTPLTDISVDVTSQVEGGTKSSVECVEGEDVIGGTDGLYVTDPAIDLTDLEPGTYVCTVVVDP